jgi:hypothetical protein
MGIFGRIYDLLSLRSRERRTAELLATAPMRAIKDVLNHQMVKVSGKLRIVGEPLTAPLTGRACACYSVTVERPGELLILDQDGRDFLLDDGTAVALVRVATRGTRVVLTKDSRRWAGPLDAVDRDQAAFLRWHGHHRDHILGLPEPLTFSEGVLEAGERVAAYGTGVWEVDKNPDAWSIGYRDFPRRLHLGALPDGAVHITDVPELVASRPRPR